MVIASSVGSKFLAKRRSPGLTQEGFGVIINIRALEIFHTKNSDNLIILKGFIYYTAGGERKARDATIGARARGGNG